MRTNRILDSGRTPTADLEFPPAPTEAWVIATDLWSLPAIRFRAMGNPESLAPRIFQGLIEHVTGLTHGMRPIEGACDSFGFSDREEKLLEEIRESRRVGLSAFKTTWEDGTDKAPDVFPIEFAWSQSDIMRQGVDQKVERRQKIAPEPRRGTPTGR